MRYKITRVDAENAQVHVTFTSGDIVHRRTVNACMKPDGTYDPDATKLRVADVARGVAVKVEVGAIGAPPPAPVEEPAALVEEPSDPA